MGAQQKMSPEARKGLNKHEISSWCEVGGKRSPRKDGTKDLDLGRNQWEVKEDSLGGQEESLSLVPAFSPPVELYDDRVID